MGKTCTYVGFKDTSLMLSECGEKLSKDSDYFCDRHKNKEGALKLKASQVESVSTSVSSSSSESSWPLFETVLSNKSTYVPETQSIPDTVEDAELALDLNINLPRPPTRSPLSSVLQNPGKLIFKLITLGLICQCHWID